MEEGIHKRAAGWRGLSSRWRDRLTGLAIVCVVATVSQWLRGTEIVRNLEWEVYARFSKARDVRRYADRIAVIEIDDNAYSLFDDKVPLPRDYLARLITTLCEKAHPRAIGLDVLLDTRLTGRRAPEDAALEEALQEARAQGVAIVMAADSDSLRGGKPIEPDTRFLPYGQLGQIQVQKGAEDELREVAWVKRRKGVTSLAFAAALAAQEASIPPSSAASWVEQRVRPRGEYGRYIVYTPEIGSDGGLSEPFLRLSSDEIAPENPQLETLKDRIVLIGATSEWAGDDHQTPLATKDFPNGVRPGIHVQAFALLTLLAPGVTVPGPALDWFLSASACGLFLALLYRRGALWSLLIGGALLVAAAFGALILFASSGYLINLGPSLLAIFGCTLVWWLRRSLYLRACFDTFVSRPVLRGIGSVHNLADFQTETGTSSVMFCDLVGYGRASQRLKPPQVFAMTNYYLAPLAEIVERHGGLLERYTGDGCLAYFGAPLPGRSSLPPEKSARQAVEAAMEIQAMAQRLYAEAESQGLPPLRMGVGVHTGPLSVGLIGSWRRAQFSIMGETVNTASRIESVGHLAEVEPPLQTRILVSAATAECLAGIVSLEEKKTFITVKEFAGRVFEVLGMATEGLRPAGQGEEQAASVTHA